MFIYQFNKFTNRNNKCMSVFEAFVKVAGIGENLNDIFIFMKKYMILRRYFIHNK